MANQKDKKPKSKTARVKKSPAKVKHAMEPVDFEQSLDQLNQLAEMMERGNLPLEEALKHFENGVVLIRQCQKALSKAEQRVQILSQSEDGDALEPFDNDDNN